MSVFVDSGVFVAFHNRRDGNHSKALKLVKKIIAGELGTAYTSTYIFDEAVTVALWRTGRSEVALNVGEMILGEGTPPFIVVLKVDAEAFDEAWRLFKVYAEKRLSFTDCSSLALMKQRNVESIASFDKDFDGITPRIF